MDKAKQEDQRIERNQIFIEADTTDPRLKEFEGRKRTFDGGKAPTRYLSNVRQEKWLDQKRPAGNKTDQS